MALKLSRDLKNYVINEMIQKLCGTMGTGGTAVLTIYTGTQPTDADTSTSGTSGTILCQISNLCWGGTVGDASTIGCTSGTCAFTTTAGFNGTAVATGTAGWASIRTYTTGFTGSAATHRIDGEVGTASTCTFVINSVSITSGGVVTVVSCPLSIS